MASQQNVVFPKFGKSALELLDPKNAPPKSVAEEYGVQFSGGIIGALALTIKNWASSRPLIAGAVWYPVYFAAGYAISELVMSHRRNYYAERDAVFRHYVELHPEDFPPPERKKYGEVLLEWIPIR